AGRSAGWRSARMGDLRARRTGGVFGTDVEPPGAILIRGGRIESVMTEAEARVLQSDFPYLDAGGRAVIPGFVDAHTHLVFAGDRADEYAARLEGRPYEAAGIMRTVERTRAAGVDELINGVVGRAEACLDLGTTTIEVKSGYGLETGTERRSLKAVWAADERVEATLIPTFLGAHLDLGGEYIDQ